MSNQKLKLEAGEELYLEEFPDLEEAMMFKGILEGDDPRRSVRPVPLGDRYGVAVKWKDPVARPSATKRISPESPDLQ